MCPQAILLQQCYKAAAAYNVDTSDSFSVSFPVTYIRHFKHCERYKSPVAVLHYTQLGTAKLVEVYKYFDMSRCQPEIKATNFERKLDTLIMKPIRLILIIK